MFLGEIYTSDKTGSDEAGDGTAEKPFKTILQAMRHAGKEPFPTIFVDSKEEGKKYDVAAKSQLKKIQKMWVRESYKAADKAKAEEEGNDKRQQNLEDAKKIEIKEDPSLPKAKIVKISQGRTHFYLNINQLQLGHNVFVKNDINMLHYIVNNSSKAQLSKQNNVDCLINLILKILHGPVLCMIGPIHPGSFSWF